MGIQEDTDRLFQHHEDKDASVYAIHILFGVRRPKQIVRKGPKVVWERSFDLIIKANSLNINQ